MFDKNEPFEVDERAPVATEIKVSTVHIAKSSLLSIYMLMM